jgi:hypothetical protein
VPSPRRAQAAAGPRAAERGGSVPQALVEIRRERTRSTRRGARERSRRRSRRRGELRRPKAARQHGGGRRARPRAARSTGPLETARLRARPRRGRDRRDHVVHQHLEPVGDARRRPAGQERGREGPDHAKPWVKTSLAPGSKVVTDYYEGAGLTPYLDKLGFNLVGYGCTTCIGNSGPLPEEISAAVNEATSASSRALGQPQLRGPHQPDVKMNYLASPPLVVAYALAGTMDIDLDHRAARHRRDGNDRSTCATSGRRAPRSRGDRRRRSQPEMFTASTPTSSTATSAGAAADVPTGDVRVGRATRPTCASRRTSRACREEPARSPTSSGARVLAKLGDSVTTDHISPAGSIKADSPPAST